MISDRKIILVMVTDSPKNIIPMIITPIAPIAVQHAYAVPVSIVLNENERNNKLNIMAIIVKIV